MKRASGILMPVFSLPSKYGIGCFSKEAYKFVDKLKKAGQSYWQILPLVPPGGGDSPYMSASSFAGNPLLLDLELLQEEEEQGGTSEVSAPPAETAGQSLDVDSMSPAEKKKYMIQKLNGMRG